MTYKTETFSIMEMGQRKNQEDCIFPSGKHFSDTNRTFILCDGMGGHDAGEVASSTVCEVMGRAVSECQRSHDGSFTDADLQKAVSDAFDALDIKDKGGERKMGTTMTFLKLHNEGATIAHIGDSRVYHIRPGKDGDSTEILFVTHDHSLKNDLIKAGVLESEEDIRNFKQKSVITRAMQPKMERRSVPDIHHTSDIRPGDYFYMCSDGMLESPEMENGEYLRNIFSDKVESAERKAEILRKVTAQNKDNHSAIIIRITDVNEMDNAQKKQTKSSAAIIMAVIAAMAIAAALIFAVV